jgi:hypothetical protein
MTVGYHVDAGRPRISYNCTGARSEWGGPHCQHLSGGCLDADVAGQVLQVLSPAAVEVHIQAVQQALADRAAVEKVWQQRLERAQQQVDRARRCYRLAEPEHRLVVRQLEQDWEQSLAAQRDLQEQWRRFQRQAPSSCPPVTRRRSGRLPPTCPACGRHPASPTPTARRSSAPSWTRSPSASAA